ncbi:MAG: hypothetical protein AAGD25_27855 [Cyanobacteria bacterium P01_F01_bin.150]
MTSATATQPQLASFEINVNGSPLPLEVAAQVVNIKVDEDVAVPSMFTIELGALDDSEPEIPLLDDEQFAIANEVEIKLGYGEDVATLLKGEIASLEPEFHFNHGPRLTVRGYDRRYLLQRGRKTRTFVQKKDSDIVDQIAQESGLQADVVDSEVTHDYIIQANQTDLEFLQSRARQIRYEVIADDRTLLFRPVGNDGSAAFTISLEDDLLDFYPRLSSLGLAHEVLVRGWNVEEKTAIVGQAGAGDVVSTMGGDNSGADLAEDAAWRVGDRPITTQAEADQLAQAQLNWSALSLIRGEGTCRGRTDLRAGTVLEMSGLGRQFSGQYYVTTTRHCYSAGGYHTYFTVRRSGV